MRRTLLLSTIVLLAAVHHAKAVTINVSGTCTLGQAIRAANLDIPFGACPAGSGADIIVLPARSIQVLRIPSNAVFGPTGLPVVTSPITLLGNDSTIIRPTTAPALRIFAITRAGSLILRNLTLRGGNAPGDIESDADGGAILNYGRLTLVASNIIGNTAADEAGGIYSLGVLQIIGSTIAGNRAGFHTGGIMNWGPATIVRSTVARNSSAEIGVGGIGNYSARARMTILNSTISGNGAEDAGGIDNGGILIVSNSTITGNQAEDNAGGVVSFGNGTFDSQSHTGLRKPL